MMDNRADLEWMQGTANFYIRPQIVKTSPVPASKSGLCVYHAQSELLQADARSGRPMAEAMFPMTVEQALVACANGDRAALRWIYQTEAPKMVGVAMRIVKRRSIAEDIVQDCFLRIWQAAASFDGTLGNGRSWIYAIVRNRSLNVLRGEVRFDLVEDMTPLVGASEVPSPEDVLLQVSDNAALRRCLERLDDVRRRIIVMAYTEGLSHGELSARCNVPLGTIKSWIRRSLGALRECLG